MLSPLNPGPISGDRHGPLAPAEIWPMVVDGRPFALDASTLDLYRLTPTLAAALSEAGTEVLGLRQAPVFRPPKADDPPCVQLVLNLTHNCNLACQYCFVREQSGRQGRCQGPAMMSLDLAQGAIRTLFGERVPRVGFFGGEPLLAWDRLREIVEWVEATWTGKDQPRFSVTTNGTLIIDEMAAWFGDRRDRFSFIVSLDGSSNRHDSLRPFLGGGGSWRAAAAGLRKLAAVGFRPTVRSTFTADGIDLVAELMTLNEICDEGFAGHVSIEPVSLTESCAFSRHSISASRLRELEPQYLAAADWFCERAKSGKRARFHHLGKMLERLLLKNPQCSECGAGRGYLTLSPSGEIHACHREKSPVGRYSAAGIEWFAERDGWRDNRLEVRRGCPSCPLRYLCGGGCRQDSLDEFGDLRMPDPLGCELTRIRFRAAVKVLDRIGPDEAAKALGIRLPNKRQMRRAQAPLQGATA